MTQLSRREMLRDVGRGMFVAGLGAALTSDLGLGRLIEGATQHMAIEQAGRARGCQGDRAATESVAVRQILQNAPFPP